MALVYSRDPHRNCRDNPRDCCKTFLYQRKFCCPKVEKVENNVKYPLIYNTIINSLANIQCYSEFVRYVPCIGVDWDHTTVRFLYTRLGPHLNHHSDH